MASKVCPHDECTEHYIHGHGGDEFFLPRFASDRDRLMKDPSVVRVSLHTADPGASGNENEAPMYPRQTVSWTAAGAGQTVLGVVSFHADPVEEPPEPGGFDAALFAAYSAGVRAEHERYGDSDDPTLYANAEGFRRWRAQWHGEWVTE